MGDDDQAEPEVPSPPQTRPNSASPVTTMPPGRVPPVEPHPLDLRASSKSGSPAERFTVRAPLGAGATGMVVRAFDEVRRHEVALKYLKRIGPDALYRFKQEFRSLAGLVHPNVVTLYELSVTEDRWAVVMELVDDARTFLEYVRPYRHWLHRPSDVATGSTAGVSAQTSDEGGDGIERGVAGLPRDDELPATIDLPDDEPWVDATSHGIPRALSKRAAIIAAELNLERLRSALLQLTEGLDTVHQRGMLHRDIKPSNVLVDQTGRVVVCDFGLVTTTHAGESRLVGTPAYMSPEQTDHGSLTSASDVYSVGVMLYEALTGQLPVDGSSVSEILAGKRHAQLRPPRELDPNVDAQLEALCMSMLDSRPDRRPDASTIRAVVGGLPTRAVLAESAPARDPFIGRERERARLLAAFGDARAGRTVGVLVSGPSGVGKSALVEDVCQQLCEQHGALVFRGRCYPNESVPFKAVDAVVDAIANHLRALPIDQVARLIPDAGELVSLCELFPVLRRATAVTVALERSSQTVPPSRVRSLARLGLQRLVGALAHERPVIIAIDDLQWGDPDSEPLLRELIESPQSPGALVLGTCRNEAAPREDGDPVSLVATLGTSRSEGLDIHRDLRHLELDPLDPADGAHLVRAITGSSIEPAAIEKLLDDAEGHPMFVIELAHAARAGETVVGAKGLDALIERRIAALPLQARRLVEAAATAQWPQPLELLSRALDLSQEAATLAQLVDARMIRMVHGPDGERLTTYHDRVREVAQARLSEPGRRRLHRKLALAFERAPELDFEALALHWHEAGDERRAVHYLVRAGDRAVTSRAFGRAAHHYERALGLGRLEDPARGQVRLDYAHALYHSGNFREAANAYSRVAEVVEADEALRLRGLALICILHSGDMARATSFARTTARGVGIRIPRRRITALMSIAWDRLVLALRKPRIRRLRSPDKLGPAERHRMDMVKNITVALGTTEPLAGFASHTRYLRAAIRVGDPAHLVHALTQEAVFLSLLSGFAKQDQVAGLLDQAAIAAEATRSRFYLAFVEGRRYTCDHVRVERSEEAGHRLNAVAVDIAHAPEFSRDAELFQMYALNAYGLAGAFRALSTALPAALKRAMETRNRHIAETISRQSGIFVHLAHDRPELARELVARGRPSTTTKMTSAEWAFQARSADVEIYADGWRHAAAPIERLWERSRGTATATIPLFSSITGSMRGRLGAVMAGLEPDERSRHLARARAMYEGLEKFARSLPQYAGGHAALVGAMIAGAEGDLDASVRALRRAVECFEAHEIRLHEMPARFALGRLLQGDEGAALERRAREWMTQEGVVRPERFVLWQCPMSLVLEASRPRPRSRPGSGLSGATLGSRPSP